MLLRPLVVLVGLLSAAPALAGGQEPRAPIPEDTGGWVGAHGGQPYLRLWNDRLRLYPGGVVRVDATVAPTPEGLPPELGSENGGPRLAIRRLGLSLSGELLRRVAFTAGVEMGGQRVGETPYVGPLTRRWVPADAHDGTIRPAEASLSVLPWSWLSLTAGQVYAPFSMANRTREPVTPYMEQPMPIRGFAVPNDKVLGVMAWGELDERTFGYEVGVFNGTLGDALTSGNVDGMARVFARPLAPFGRGVFFELAQIGLSARLGQRDPGRVTAEYPSLATGNGYVLWQPGYVDSRGRITRVLPSNSQRAIGGEVRLPVRTPTHAVFDLRGEVYYVRNDTREAVAGFEASSTERFGMLEGVSWVASLAWWACFIPGFGQLVTGEPGIVRPIRLDDRRAPAMVSALEASIIAGGVHATYTGASRGGLGDAAAPGGDITAYQLGGAVQYWLGANLRVAINYMAYVAPQSGTASTQVVVPDNLPRTDGSSGSGHTQHEVGLRLAASF